MTLVPNDAQKYLLTTQLDRVNEYYRNSAQVFAETQVNWSIVMVESCSRELTKNDLVTEMRATSI